MIKTKNNFYQQELEVENNNIIDDVENDENCSSCNESMDNNEYNRKGWKIGKLEFINFEKKNSASMIKKCYILPEIFLIFLNV